MDERELIGLIDAALGFTVDADGLRRRGKDLADHADEVRRVKRELAVVDGRGFGWIGRESGFAEALKDFAETLGERVDGAVSRAEKLGHALTQAGTDYRRDDRDAAESFRGA
ncbi:hypothetical protein V5P93_006098 [Actinokineospora auranticolor]|uniref:Excreted virulence factor EspC (Type VII ESX diderm) n=1 Tax=Actinokineospora auranticolor TaxID=155976 RepID=A0A2S6GG31_9PSEU|nr:hypothetical protein [Actinokineospora auranticolor]PPK64187.1 hypothetical protein CLV40_12151 [Actinokineospora auranticolor]